MDAYYYVKAKKMPWCDCVPDVNFYWVIKKGKRSRYFVLLVWWYSIVRPPSVVFTARMVGAHRPSPSRTRVK